MKKQTVLFHQIAVPFILESRLIFYPDNKEQRVRLKRIIVIAAAKHPLPGPG